MTNDYPNYVNEIIPADLQDEMTDNRKETLTDFGISVMNGAKSGLFSTQVIAVDDTTSAEVTYLQFANGNIHKWVDNVRYKAEQGTLWAGRVEAVYTAETV